MTTPDHESRAHAILSASKSHQWMNCPGCIRAEAAWPQQESSEHAEWGTRCHELSESILQAQFDVPGPSFNKFLAKLEADYQSIDPEMFETAMAYCNYVWNIAKGGIYFIEHRFDLSWLYQGMFGTCDAVVPTEDILHIIDLKGGKGVRVDAHENSQLLYYALGAAHDYSYLYEFKRVIVHIVQPRLNHFDSYELTLEDLDNFGSELRVAAIATEALDAPVRPGEWCKWCRAKPTCPALVKQAQEAAMLDFESDEITLERALELAENLEPWIAAVRHHAKARVLSGNAVPGWKVVAGRNSRAWGDAKEVAAVMRKYGIGEAFTEPELKSVAQLEKVVKQARKEDPDRIIPNLEDFIEVKAGQPTLTRESDRRPALNAADLAAKDFE